VRRVDAGEGEDEERTLPVGERRRSVCSWGVVCVARKVERGFVRSIVWDITAVVVVIGLCVEIEEGLRVDVWHLCPVLQVIDCVT